MLLAGAISKISPISYASGASLSVILKQNKRSELSDIFFLKRLIKNILTKSLIEHHFYEVLLIIAALCNRLHEKTAILFLAVVSKTPGSNTINLIKP